MERLGKLFEKAGQNRSRQDSRSRVYSRQKIQSKQPVRAAHTHQSAHERIRRNESLRSRRQVREPQRVIHQPVHTHHSSTLFAPPTTSISTSTTPIPPLLVPLIWE